MNTDTNKGNGLMTKKRSVFRPLLSMAGITAAILVSAGCSITSDDIGLTGISIDNNNRVTATVTIDNIDIDNFTKEDSTTLSNIKIYYAYSPDKAEALEADLEKEGLGPKAFFSGFPEKEYDGVYTYSVPSEDVADFKNGTDTSYSKTLTFDLPEEAKGKKIDFVVYLDGVDYNNGESGGSLDGGAASRIFSYTWCAAATYANVGDYTGKGGAASAWKVTVTPCIDTIENLDVKVNNKGSKDGAWDGMKITGGTVVFAVAVNLAAEDVSSVTAVVNGIDVAAAAE